MGLRPWTATDTLWYDYRDPWAEGEPGALERLLALRRPGGWQIPETRGHPGEFIADGTDSDADVTLKQLRGSGITCP
jgi:hypothetical protein